MFLTLLVVMTILIASVAMGLLTAHKCFGIARRGFYRKMLKNNAHGIDEAK